MRTTYAALCLASLVLSACGEAAPGSGQEDRFAGLDQQIRVWKDEVAAGDPLCASKLKGQACEAFEIACKSERPIAPDEQKRGVSAKIVAAMTFQGWEAKGGVQPVSKTATFTRTGDAWSRSEAGPVNFSSCADL